MHSLPDILENMKQNLLSKRSKKTAWKIIKEYFSFFWIGNHPGRTMDTHQGSHHQRLGGSIRKR